ncbi:transglutaminase-like domain-containing protein [Polymorphospora lycopeni]|uniref:Transglutaminase-like domain-containing protein n=1 Tax=Polymorphospora lycopeni TaxID=3140240 RepID=A0ABV5CQD8_9ACTN
MPRPGVSRPPPNWGHALERVVRTPAAHRRPVDVAFVRAVLRCSDAELETLRDIMGTGGETFDAFDVWNVGLYSGSRASRPELEMAYHRRLLTVDGDWTGPVDFRFTLAATCPSGGGCDSTLWSRPEITGARWTRSAVDRGSATWAGEVRQSGIRSTIRHRPVGALWRSAVESYRYHYTSPPLAAEVPTTRRRRVGDCTALSELLVAEFGAQGIPARTGDGFLFGGHTARVHRWAEVRDSDGVWKPLDLSMALLAGEFLPAGYREFCFGGLPNRLVHVSGEAGVMVRHRCRAGTSWLEPVVRGTTVVAV